jgi:hypothetical protein
MNERAGRAVPLSLLAAETAGVIAEIAAGGGPAVAVAAGAVAPLAWNAVRELWIGRTRRAANVAAESMQVGMDIFEERILEYNYRLELFTRVVHAAAHSNLEVKITALGLVLAQGLDDEGDFDEAFALAGALADIEGPHILVLEKIDRLPIPPVEIRRDPTDEPIGWESSDVAKALPEVAAVVDNVVAALSRHGLIRDRGRANYPGTVGPAIWNITDLGRRCLFLIDKGRSFPAATEA